MIRFSKYLMLSAFLLLSSFGITGCGGTEEPIENLVAIEPATKAPTAQPSFTPRATWTPWPTKTPTPLPSPTIDPFATAVTPVIEQIILPSPESFTNTVKSDNPPSLVFTDTYTGTRIADLATGGNDAVFEGLDSDQPTAVPTEVATATATVETEPTATATTETTATATPELSGTAVFNNQASPTPEFIPTNDPACFNFLQFVDDITIPDGEEIEAGAEFVKTWRVVNLGTCYISSSYILFPLNDVLEVVRIESLPLIGPDEEGNLSVTLRAPTEPGRYQSNWQVQPPDDGDPFGQLYLEIQVVE